MVKYQMGASRCRSAMPLRMRKLKDDEVDETADADPVEDLALAPRPSGRRSRNMELSTRKGMDTVSTVAR